MLDRILTYLLTCPNTIYWISYFNHCLKFQLCYVISCYNKFLGLFLNCIVIFTALFVFSCTKFCSRSFFIHKVSICSFIYFIFLRVNYRITLSSFNYNPNKILRRINLDRISIYTIWNLFIQGHEKHVFLWKIFHLSNNELLFPQRSCTITVLSSILFFASIMIGTFLHPIHI